MSRGDGLFGAVSLSGGPLAFSVTSPDCAVAVKANESDGWSLSISSRVLRRAAIASGSRLPPVVLAVAEMVADCCWSVAAVTVSVVLVLGVLDDVSAVVCGADAIASLLAALDVAVLVVRVSCNANKQRVYVHFFV